MKTFLVLMLMMTTAHAQVFCSYEPQPCNNSGHHYVCFKPWSDRTFCSATDLSPRRPVEKTLRCHTRMTFIGHQTLTAEYPQGKFRFAFLDTLTGTETPVTEGDFNVTGQYAGHVSADLTGGTLQAEEGSGYVSRLDLNQQVFKMNCKIE